MLSQQEIREEFGTADLAQELFIKVSRLLLVLIEQLPVAEIRLTLFALIFAFLHNGLFGRLFVGLLMLHKLLVPKERFATQFAHEGPDVDVFQVVLVNLLDGRPAILSTVHTVLGVRFVMREQ